MKVTLQVFTKKGFYGPEQTANIDMIGVPGTDTIVGLMMRLPDKLEGERFVDWTKVDIHIDRADTPVEAVKPKKRTDSALKAAQAEAMVKVLSEKYPEMLYVETLELARDLMEAALDASMNYVGK